MICPGTESQAGRRTVKPDRWSSSSCLYQMLESSGSEDRGTGGQGGGPDPGGSDLVM